jgi:hypothetical protein
MREEPTTLGVLFASVRLVNWKLCCLLIAASISEMVVRNSPKNSAVRPSWKCQARNRMGRADSEEQSFSALICKLVKIGFLLAGTTSES